MSHSDTLRYGNARSWRAEQKQNGKFLFNEIIYGFFPYNNKLKVVW